ncbi:hypothetical protein WICPIJ_001322 [Wickerhamomyces pijperi]|uniref:Uncharacterized protein n=1 Tax=Wickerhamomyces pijperi TaxID=599730 RepID=A0A9P8QE71_WICPI|nr:hypothetical protein WICPIJ_001322 [Wickerhamomyces pijperi]
MEGPGVRNLGRNFGVRKLKLPITQFGKSKRTAYCNINPSFFNKGHNENNAMLLIQATRAMMSVSLVEYSNVIGSSGTKMVFSCTWKLNMKKDMEQTAKAHGKRDFCGLKKM